MYSTISHHQAKSSWSPSPDHATASTRVRITPLIQPSRKYDIIRNSQVVMLTLKGDSFIQDPPILMSKVVAQTVKRYLGSLSSSSFFSQNAVLVPTPKSSLMQAGTLWVPNRLASALVSEGLGETVSPCLVRTMPLS